VGNVGFRFIHATNYLVDLAAAIVITIFLVCPLSIYRFIADSLISQVIFDDLGNIEFNE
jgi:hypothetical protein